jgi:hypothetical protein
VYNEAPVGPKEAPGPSGATTVAPSARGRADVSGSSTDRRDVLAYPIAGAVTSWQNKVLPVWKKVARQPSL